MAVAPLHRKMTSLTGDPTVLSAELFSSTWKWHTTAHRRTTHITARNQLPTVLKLLCSTISFRRYLYSESPITKSNKYYREGTTNVFWHYCIVVKFFKLILQQTGVNSTIHWHTLSQSYQWHAAERWYISKLSDLLHVPPNLHLHNKQCSYASSSSSSCSRSRRGPLRHSCAMATKNGWSP